MTSTTRTSRPGSAPIAPRQPTAGQERDRPGERAADDRLDADTGQAAQLEVRQAVVQDREQREGLDPGRHGDRQRDARQPVRSDEDDRQRCS